MYKYAGLKRKGTGAPANDNDDSDSGGSNNSWQNYMPLMPYGTQFPAQSPAYAPPVNPVANAGYVTNNSHITDTSYVTSLRLDKLPPVNMPVSSNMPGNITPVDIPPIPSGKGTSSTDTRSGATRKSHYVMAQSITDTRHVTGGISANSSRAGMSNDTDDISETAKIRLRQQALNDLAVKDAIKKGDRVILSQQFRIAGNADILTHTEILNEGVSGNSLTVNQEGYITTDGLPAWGGGYVKMNFSPGNVTYTPYSMTRKAEKIQYDVMQKMHLIDLIPLPTVIEQKDINIVQIPLLHHHHLPPPPKVLTLRYNPGWSTFRTELSDEQVEFAENIVKLYRNTSANSIDITVGLSPTGIGLDNISRISYAGVNPFTGRCSTKFPNNIKQFRTDKTLFQNATGQGNALKKLLQKLLPKININVKVNRIGNGNFNISSK